MSFMDPYYIPQELYTALKNSLRKVPKPSSVSEPCVKLLESVQHLTEIPPKSYLKLQELFLNIQAFDLITETKKHDMKLRSFNISKFPLEVQLYPNHPDIDKGYPVILRDCQKRKYYCEVVKIKKHRKSEKMQFLFVKRPPSFVKMETLQFVPCFWTINACRYALNKLSSYNIRKLMYPTMQTTAYYLSNEIVKWNQTAIEDDPEQQQAIINILNRTAQPAPYILFGPPGTGKTTTLVEAVLQIWQKDPLKCVLVLAASNTAVDEVAKRLVSRNIIPLQYIYRLYSKSRKSKDVPKQIIKCSNFFEPDDKSLREHILKKPIILTTIASSAKLLKLELPPQCFSYIIIDEASQCNESEILIPYALTCGKNKSNETVTHAQIVLCGDPFQLGPVTRLKIAKNLLSKSVLERLMEYEPYQMTNNNYNPRYITRLRRNYRSREAIIHLPSRMFYHDSLKACFDFNDSRWKLKWPELKNKDFPIVFCAIYGEEERLKPLTSVHNKKETKTVIHYVKRLLSSKFCTFKLKQRDIGIVTPFTAQKIQIERALKENKLKNILVGTVDIFQGQEKNVIIISTVRSKLFVHNEEAHIGFLSHPKRFNVALTRAKLFVLVIGNPDVLCTNPHWKELWDYCAENDSCIELNDEDKENKSTKTVGEDLQCITKSLSELHL